MVTALKNPCGICVSRFISGYIFLIKFEFTKPWKIRFAFPQSCILHASVTRHFSFSVKYSPYSKKNISAHFTMSSWCSFNVFCSSSFVSCKWAILFLITLRSVSVNSFSRFIIRFSSSFLTLSISPCDKIFFPDFA